MPEQFFKVANWPATIPDLRGDDLLSLEAWARQVKDWQEELLRILDHTLATEGNVVGEAVEEHPYPPTRVLFAGAAGQITTDAEFTYDAANNWMYLNSQALKMAGPLTVEALSLINQDLTTDSATARLAQLGLGGAPSYPLHITKQLDAPGYWLYIQDGAAGSAAFGEGTSGAGNTFPLFYMTSAGVSGVGGGFIGMMPAAQDAYAALLAAIVLDGRRSTGAALTAADVLCVRNFGTVLGRVTYGGHWILTGDLQVNGGDIGIPADTDLLGLAANVLTVRGAVVPDSASGQNLGSTALEWANLYIGTGRAYFGATQKGYVYDDGSKLIIGRTA